MGFTNDACWFLLIKNVAHKKNNNNKKREAALKNEAGGDKKHDCVCFFTWPKLSLLTL